jgi:hypothetical protein
MNLVRTIDPSNHTAYSINLERDSFNPEVINDYQITPKTREVLLRFVNALEGEKVSAWEIIGPYGMGKSSFLNYLVTVAASNNNTATKIALDKLKQIDSGLYIRFINAKNKNTDDRGFLSIPVTADFEPVNRTIVRGLRKMILAIHNIEYKKIQEKVERILASDNIESPMVIDCFRELRKIDSRPIIIAIDEFGKNLEYMGYYHKKGDLFVLQQLAEMNSIYLWVSLHHSFNDYLIGLSTIQQQEWSKIQGRFEEIPFIESTDQMLESIKRLLKLLKPKTKQDRICQWASYIQDKMKEFPLIKNGISRKDDIAAIYPLHPFTAIALIEVVRRFAQNERTLVSFLCSGNNYALPAQLNRLKLDGEDKLHAVGLEALYDYFFQISNTYLANRPESQRWIEIQSIIEASGHFPKEEKSLLKTIGVLNLITDSLGLKANDEIITILMETTCGIEPKTVKEMIQNLVQRGVIVFRDYANEYRLWEGSSIDIKEVVDLEKQKLGVLPIETLVKEHIDIPPKIAARHSYRKGTIRRFECLWKDISSINEGDLTPSEGYDGSIIYCFGNKERFFGVPCISNIKSPLVFAYAPIKDTLKELALEEIACQRALENNAQIAYDKVAQKELDFRLRTARNKLKDYLERIYKPGSKDVKWYVNNDEIEIKNSKGLSTLLSDLCDDYFRNAPIIRNEIINADKLSSAAARAQRELVEAMTIREREEKLGFEGCGPEVALYRSMLLDTGLHVLDESKGSWALTLKGKDKSLEPMWTKINELVENAGMQGITVESILDTLKKPPFGMRQGPSLIYIALYILVNTDTIAVFKERDYQPYLSAADMALLLKRPDLFIIKNFKATKEEEQVFAVYQSLFKNIKLNEGQDLRNLSLIGVVGPLVKFISKLPNYSKKTREISIKAQRIRSIIMNATDPIRFLFQELPEGLGLDINSQTANPEYWKKELLKRLQSTLSELGQAFPRLNERIEKVLLKVFQCDSLEQLYNSQHELTMPLVDICEDPDLKAVLRSMSRTNTEPIKWMQGLAGIIVKKPVDSWDDQDFAIFAVKLHDYADRIEQLRIIWSKTYGISKENLKLISIMDSKGIIKRDIVDITSHDYELDNILNQAMDLPIDKAKILLVHLAEKIF